MTFAFDQKKRKPVKAALILAIEAPKDKKLARFQKKHAGHKTREVPMAGGRKTMRECRDCGCAHFQKHD